MPITTAVSNAIASGQPMDQVRDLAAASGYRPMQHMALELVAEGKTSMDEVRRKVSFDLATEIRPIAEAAEGPLRIAS